MPSTELGCTLLIEIAEGWRNAIVYSKSAICNSIKQNKEKEISSAELLCRFILQGGSSFLISRFSLCSKTSVSKTEEGSANLSNLTKYKIGGNPYEHHRRNIKE